MSKEWKNEERRQSNRVHRHEHAEARLVQDDEAQFKTIQIMNISEGGARFISSQPFDVGEICVLRISGEERQAKVHHCKQLFKGYAIRTEFVKEAG